MIEPLLEAERALTMGSLDRAERLYRGVTEADPRNAIALVGLARVAIERGDDRAAYGFARRALELDPENPAAVGLEARLVEVFVARGEPSPRDAVAPPEQVVAEGAEPHRVAVEPVQPSRSEPAQPPPPGRVGLLRRLFGRR